MTSSAMSNSVVLSIVKGYANSAFERALRLTEGEPKRVDAAFHFYIALHRVCGFVEGLLKTSCDLEKQELEGMRRSDDVLGELKRVIDLCESDLYENTYPDEEWNNPALKRCWKTLTDKIFELYNQESRAHMFGLPPIDTFDLEAQG